MSGFSTRAIHAGEDPDPATRAHTTPIYQTATFSFETAAEKDAAVEAGMSWDQGAFFYSRTANPTTAALEAKLADLEGAEEAVVGASGMAALSTTLLSLLEAGDHLVVPTDRFVITRFLVEQDLPRRGVAVTAVDTTDVDAVRGALRPETKAVLTESLSNPLLGLADIAGLAEATGGHAALVVDNTFLTPYLLRPLEHGADLVVHAATKYLAGHGDALSGVVAGPKRLLDSVRWELDAHGSCASPFNSWLVLRGARTLPLRMEAHCRNALALARLLEERPEVEWVRYPGLVSHPQHELAGQLLGGRFGGMLTFRLRGAAEEMRAFADALELSSIAVSLGDLTTLVYPQPRRDNLIRVSVGCEDADDIAADFERGLAAARAVSSRA